MDQINQSFLKKVYVQTWGCQMNVADTERMFQQARTLRSVAYIVSVVFIIVLAVCARYLWRYKRGQDGTRPTTRWRF